jgi:hypothetical protein
LTASLVAGILGRVREETPTRRHGALRRWITAPAVAAIALLTAPAAHADMTCTHSGPPANVVTFTSGPRERTLSLRRAGDEIKLYSEHVYGVGRPKKGKPRIRRVYESPVCAPIVPTVDNTDRIEVILNTEGDADLDVSMASGPLAPGATPELDGTSEIEIGIVFDEDGQVANFVGDGGVNHFRFGVGHGLKGVNLNAQLEALPDVDATMTYQAPPPDSDSVDLRGGPLAKATTLGGDDSVSTGGGPEFEAPFGGALIAYGGSGNDTIAATGHRYNALFGGAGDDRLFGGSKFNDISAGNGDDLVVGGDGQEYALLGKGHDLAILKGGNDHVNSLDRTRDRVRCGGGRDLILRDRGDRLRRCDIKFNSRAEVDAAQ